jgi:hypothetical protein
VQLLGFSAVATATMTTCTTVGVAVGFVMGGAAGDALAVRFPNASRPFINQLSMALAGPLSVVLFKAMPGAALRVCRALSPLGKRSSWPAGALPA